jgi:outer membrane protein
MKVMRPCKLVVLMVFALVVGVMAAPPADSQGPIGLQKAIEVALENNYAVLTAREAIQGAEHLRKSAMTDFFPKLRAESSFTSLDRVPTVTQPATPAIPVFDVNNPANQIGFIPGSPASTQAVGHRDSWTARGSATQPLFTGGAIWNRYQQAKLGVESTQTSLERVRQDLSLQVVQAYFNILNAIEQKKVADKAVQLLENQRDVSQEFFNVGMIPKNDLLRTEVQLAQRVREQTIAENAIEAAKAQFNLVLQRDVQTLVEPEDILSYEAALFDLEGSIREAHERRLELREAELRTATDARQVNVVASSYYPQVQLTFSGFKSEGTSTSGGAGLTEGWSVVAGATWTFWEWGKTREDVSAAESQVRRDRYAQSLLRDQIAVEVKNAYLALITTERNIATTKKAIEQAEEAFRMNQERYKEQVGTITEVLDSETQLVQAESDYYTALSNYNVAKASMYRAMGLKVYEASPRKAP